MSAQVADATTTRPLSWSAATIDQVANAGEAAAAIANAMTVLPHPVLIVNPVAPASRTGNRPVRQCAPWLGPRPHLRTARALCILHYRARDPSISFTGPASGPVRRIT